MSFEEVILKRKNQIRELLINNPSKEYAASMIAHLTGLHYYVVLDILKDLISKNDKIKKIKRGLRTYYYVEKE